MKRLGQFCALVVLTLSVTLTSYAGHIDCGVTSTEPTAAGYMPSGVTAAGEMQYGLLLLIVALV